MDMMMMSSNNPFDDGRSSRQPRSRNRRPSAALGGGVTSAAVAAAAAAASFGSGEPPIWAARHVEWPIPSALSIQNYNRLVKASKQAGQQLGISTSTSSSATAAAAATTTTTMAIGARASSTEKLLQQQAQKQQHYHKNPQASGTDGRSEVGTDASNYLGFSGLMSRVLNTSGASDKAGDDASLDHHHLQHLRTGDSSGAGGLSASSSSRPIRPPRPGCVAAANGWIVAALECPNTTTAAMSNDHSLRLVSRWNVRRGGTADQWNALPPPVDGNGRLVHIFVDPTGSHIFVSGANGEAYYLHSSTQRQIQKLAGFGRNPDGTILSKDSLTGVPATTVAHRRDEASQSAVQAGLTAGTYVTALAWDKEKGTEGSSKRILLGTSAGEIYEYSLVSPNSTDQEDASVLPILLHKLYKPDTSDPTEVGAAVTGLFFERLRTGLLVIAATSGRNKRTRFYTFYSAHNTSFRMVMADQQYASLVELPGSVDFADLRLCSDHFGLRTATGIYYGTIDRSLSGPAVLSGSTGMIVDSGILPYDDGGEARAGMASLPVSLSLTPNHLITLSEHNTIRFINRVAQKVIQKEHVDVSSNSQGIDESHMGIGELLMDIRRPDQVWLRKGRSLVHISSSQEDRDVWKYTLKKCIETPVKNKAAAQEITSGVLSPEEKAIESMFEQAKSLCTNNVQKAVVTSVRAEYHLFHGRAELAAKYLAQCPSTLKPFADTSVRLALPKLGIEDPTGYNGSTKARTSLEASNLPLIVYLTDKMRASRAKEDNMTSTMLGAWLTELILHDREEQQSSQSRYVAAPRQPGQLLAEFLNSNIENMDAKTVLKILASHDVGPSECALFAAKSGDISTAVNAALSMGVKGASGAYRALQILNDAPFQLAEPLYYKHALTFLSRAPTAAGDSFLAKYAEGLSPLRLLPSMMNYERKRTERARMKKALDSCDAAKGSAYGGGVEETKSASLDVHVGSIGTADAIELKLENDMHRAVSFVDDSTVLVKYLEGVIKQGCKSSAVYSYLISLYIKLEDEEPLLAFLSSHVPSSSTIPEARKRALLSGEAFDFGGDDTGSGPLDMPYALRAVLETGRHFRSAVKLYMGFGMRQQAVELALKVDPALARELAQDSVELEERKRLWLMIAKNAASDGSIRGRDVVCRVVAVLRDCGPEVLSIEDVLPFLPDFTRIDEIKDEICEALTSYSTKIDSFVKEMNECDQTCDKLRSEIARLRSHQMQMKSDARCAFSNKMVLAAGEPFYVFPSGYVVLVSALKKEVLPHLNAKQRARVEELEVALLRAGTSENEKTALQRELDGLLAAECPLTGSVMVDSIDKDFVDSDEIYNDYLQSSIERVEV